MKINEVIQADSKYKTSVHGIVTQFAILGIPIITIPYIISVVGIEKYGLFMFYQATMSVLSVIVHFGFYQSGVRDVAKCKTIKKLNYEFGTIFFAKILTTIIALLIALLFSSMDKYQEEPLLYLFSFTLLMSFSFDVTFVFQGIEKLRILMYLTLMANLVFLAMIFILLQSMEDFILLPVIYFIPKMLTSFFAFIYLKSKYAIYPMRVGCVSIVRKLTANLKFFYTNVLIILYTKMITVILGFTGGSVAVGYFSVAEQLVTAYMMLQGKISASFHPQIVRDFGLSIYDGIKKAKEGLLSILIFALSGFYFILFFSTEILTFFLKKEAVNVESTLQLLSINFVLIGISSLISIHIFLTLKKEQYLLQSSLIVAPIGISAAYLLTSYFSYFGASLTYVSVEIVVTIYFIIKAKAYNFNLISLTDLKKLLIFSIALLSILFFLDFIYEIGFNGSSIVGFAAIAMAYSIMVILFLSLTGLINIGKKMIISL